MTTQSKLKIFDRIIVLLVVLLVSGGIYRYVDFSPKTAQKTCENAQLSLVFDELSTQKRDLNILKNKIYKEQERSIAVDKFISEHFEQELMDELF